MDCSVAVTGTVVDADDDVDATAIDVDVVSTDVGVVAVDVDDIEVEVTLGV